MRLQTIASANRVLTQSELIADSELIKEIQSHLARIGLYTGEVDSIWGPKTQSAIASFCASVHLDNHKTGLYGPTFVKELLEAKAIPSKYLVESDYVKAANFLGVESAVIKAFVAVEAAGRGFFADGRAKILFEAHIFHQQTRGKFTREHPRISSRGWNRSLYYGGPREYERLEQAKALDKTAALCSASWGLGQVMGFNFKACGYQSVDAFVADMQRSEGKQILAMCAFLRTNGLVPAMKAKNWTELARRYNGPAYLVNNYHVKLAQAYQRFKG